MLSWIKTWVEKHCVLAVAGADNNGNTDNFVFTIKDTKLYVSSVTLSAKNNQKLPKLFSKGFERSVYWHEYKTIKYKNMTTENRYYILESNFVGVIRFFVLIYSNEDDNAKRFKAQRYYLPKGVIKNYNVIINGKNFHDQLIDSNTKRYEEIRTLTTGQSEDYTTWCLLYYEYIRNRYRLIAVDLSRQKELDADPEAIQQIELVEELKKTDNDGHVTDVANDQSLSVLTIKKKSKNRD